MQSKHSISRIGDLSSYKNQLLKNPPPAGHYSFVYTPSFAGSTWTTSFAFNTNSSSTNTFIIDNITMCPINSGPQVLSYNADMLMHTDYYPFGQQMPARTWQGTSEGYRYSHNSHEKEDAIYKGAQSAEYWMYDSRIGRRWERDPMTYDSQSPYVAFNNNPIYFSDPLGLEGKGGDKKSKGDDRTKGQKQADQLNKNTKGKQWEVDENDVPRQKKDPVSGAKSEPKTPSKEGINNQPDATAVKQPSPLPEYRTKSPDLETEDSPSYSFYKFIKSIDNLIDHGGDYHPWDAKFIGKPVSTRFDGIHQWGGEGSRNINFVSRWVTQYDKVNINSGGILAGMKFNPLGRHYTDANANMDAINEAIKNFGEIVKNSVEAKDKIVETWKQRPKIRVINNNIAKDTMIRSELIGVPGDSIDETYDMNTYKSGGFSKKWNFSKTNKVYK